MDGKQSVINEAIYEHFIRQGQFKVANAFQSESKVISEASMANQFMEMYTIIEDIKKDNLDSAILWCTVNADPLEKMGMDWCFLISFYGVGSTLAFQLHRTRFILLVSLSQIADALKYARDHFKKFSAKHIKGIHSYPTRDDSIY